MKTRSSASIGAAFDVLPLALAGDFNEAMKRLHTAPSPGVLRVRPRFHLW